MRKIRNLIILVSLFLGIAAINGCKKDPSVPVLTTTDVTNLSLTAATTGGNITSDGGASITARGVAYGTSANPVITGSHTTDGTGSGAFTSNLTALEPNTLYYVRAYATNKAGTAYGNQVTFTTVAVTLATLTTSPVTAITLTTAVSGGTISADGGGAVTARGVVWALTTAPTVAGDKTTNSTGTGTFTSDLTALVPGTTYYIRAYATNSAGTAYGNELTFATAALGAATLTTTVASAITQTSATLGGNITADGGSAVTARGVVYSTTTNPSITGDKTTDATGTGVFVSNISGLTAGTLYYVRAYATNNVGTAYGNEVTFTTNPVLVPTLTTAAITTITTTSATSGGAVTADGGGAITAKGVVYGTTTNPVITGDKTTNGTGTDAFVSNMASLLPGTTYYVRAYATNSAGTGYGPEVSFTTVAVSNATLTTTAITAITSTSATSGGNITADGNTPVTERGIVYGTTAVPTVSDTKVSVGTGTGIFAANLTGLAPGTTYYVRAYAINGTGTGYGNELSFTTDAVLPTLTTTAVTSITAITATSGGTITNTGGADITASGVAYGTTTAPLATGTHTTDVPTLGVFTSNLTGLTFGTYYVRAYATNSVGTAYGNELTFNVTMIVDADGNSYHTVVIGTQTWMVENLKTTSFNTSSPIANVTGNAAWAALTTPAYSTYDNVAIASATYGAFYNWYAASNANLCPTGWHVPTNNEFSTLELFQGLPTDSLARTWEWRGTATGIGTELKNATGWATGENGTNTSGLSVLPGGYRYGLDGTFQAVGMWTYLWTSTPDVPEGIIERAWYRQFKGNKAGVYVASVARTAGKYVRCIKD